jgi:hypothetical protein
VIVVVISYYILGAIYYTFLCQNVTLMWDTEEVPEREGGGDQLMPPESLTLLQKRI